MAKKKWTKSADEIYEMKVTLLGTDPPIWRRFAVNGDITLQDLHIVIQGVMGWEEAHLHQFFIGEECYLSHDPDMGLDLGLDEDALDERKFKLRDVVRGPGTRFTYEYDFGDGWEHELEVLKVGPPEPGVRCPVCLEGQRACPPEDCGGVGGYYQLLDAVADPKHEDHEDMLDWLGDEFDPASFDLEETNEMLREIR